MPSLPSAHHPGDLSGTGGAWGPLGLAVQRGSLFCVGLASLLLGGPQPAPGQALLLGKHGVVEYTAWIRCLNPGPAVALLCELRPAAEPLWASVAYL